MDQHLALSKKVLPVLCFQTFPYERRSFLEIPFQQNTHLKSHVAHDPSHVPNQQKAFSDWGYLCWAGASQASLPRCCLFWLLDFHPCNFQITRKRNVMASAFFMHLKHSLALALTLAFSSLKCLKAQQKPP